MSGGRFNLSDYVTVADRVAAFHERYGEEGRILTRLLTDDGTRIQFVAEVYTRADDDRPRASGHAEEERGQGNVNRTSALENCETSAVGRALANLGMTLSKQRASREEMAKVERAEIPAETTAPARDRDHTPARPTAARAPQSPTPARPAPRGAPPPPGAPAEATLEEWEEQEGDGHRIDWTQLWSWAKTRGIHSRHDLAAASGIANPSAATPLELWRAVEARTAAPAGVAG